MAECKPCVTSMEEQLKLMKANTTAKVDATLYRSIISGLRYLVHMRPDIAFVVCYVSCFMEDPREDHWATVKRLLRYVKGTVDHGIVFSKTGKSRLQFTVFSDADMAGTSTDGGVFLVCCLPLVGPNFMAVAETEGGSAIYVRGRVHSGGHSGVPSCVAAPAVGRADRRGCSPTNTDGGQPARHRPCEESGSTRPEKTHRREVPLPQGLCRWRVDRHRVRRNWSATHGRPHQATRPSSVHGAEEDDRHDGGLRVSSRIRKRIVK